MMVPGIFKILIMLPVLILLLLVVIGVIILSIKLCSKRPWIVVIMAMGLLLLIVPFFILVSSHRSGSFQTEISIESMLPPSQETTTAIWLPGIEDEFKANIYPSKVSAVRSLGLHIGKSVRQVFGDTWPSSIILFHGGHDRELIEEFGRAIADKFPETNWTIAPETVAVQPDEVGIRIDLSNIQTQAASWLSGSRTTTGTVWANVLAGDKKSSIKAEFVEKPWVEDLSNFLMKRKMAGRFIITRSTESCMSEAEANQQAVKNACTLVAEMIGQDSPRKSKVPVSFVKPVNPTDIIEGDFILDRFVQSFEGTTGKIWRQALLLDVSPEKLKNLAIRKAVIAQARKTSFARMFFSIIGLVALITIVYAFLNAATKGYYVWSLRIAGVVFALVVIILLLV
jgi:hypothetical protein